MAQQQQQYSSPFSHQNQPPQKQFDTGHGDQIHDCQYDYYGRVRILSLWTLSLILSLSLLFIARVWKRDVLLLFLLLFSMCVYIYTQEEARGNVLWIVCGEREINTNGNDSLTTNNSADIFYALLILHH